MYVDRLSLVTSLFGVSPTLPPSLADDWLHIPIPLWVQIESIVGTVRLRLQFISEAPFVRNVTFTFVR